MAPTSWSSITNDLGLESALCDVFGPDVPPGSDDLPGDISLDQDVSQVILAESRTYRAELEHFRRDTESIRQGLTRNLSFEALLSKSHEGLVTDTVNSQNALNTFRGQIENGCHQLNEVFHALSQTLQKHKRSLVEATTLSDETDVESSPMSTLICEQLDLLYSELCSAKHSHKRANSEWQNNGQMLIERQQESKIIRIRSELEALYLVSLESANDQELPVMQDMAGVGTVINDLMADLPTIMKHNSLQFFNLCNDLCTASETQNNSRMLSTTRLMVESARRRRTSELVLRQIRKSNSRCRDQEISLIEEAMLYIKSIFSLENDFMPPRKPAALQKIELVRDVHSTIHTTDTTSREM